MRIGVGDRHTSVVMDARTKLKGTLAFTQPNNSLRSLCGHSISSAATAVDARGHRFQVFAPDHRERRLTVSTGDSPKRRR
jgi:hypothetical protein